MEITLNLKNPIKICNEAFKNPSYPTEKKRAIGLIHKVYLAQLKNSRNYTASTKTKSEVRGGGRKPWKQKGTGQARAGSIRSPLWVGGGVIFGPKPRVVNKKINKKEKRLAILSALYLKKNELTFFDENVFNEINETTKTKKFLDFLIHLNVDLKSRILVISENPNKALWFATRNLKNIDLIVANCLNLEQLLKAQSILLSKKSLEQINLLYGKS
jgi:large subunit ribosomal protein L4